MNSTINLSQRTQEQVTELKATPVVKNKFWIVERDGEKVATIQSIDDEGGVVWVDSNRRERYPTIKMLKDRHNIDFVKATKNKTVAGHDVGGFPASGKPHNPLYDVSRKLPIYTKEEKSKSFYCAGHYLVKLGNNWSKTFCPKLITLQRYQFHGPFATIELQLEKLKELNGL